MRKSEENIDEPFAATSWFAFTNCDFSIHVLCCKYRPINRPVRPTLRPQDMVFNGIIIIRPQFIFYLDNDYEHQTSNDRIRETGKWKA